MVFGIWYRTTADYLVIPVLHTQLVGKLVLGEAGTLLEGSLTVAVADVVLASQLARAAFIFVWGLGFVGVGGVFAVLGLRMIRGKYGYFRRWFQVKNTPTMSVQSAPVGQVNIQGDLHSLGSAQPETPFTGKPCAYACWEINEQTADNYSTVVAGDLPERLRLSDETGDILVERPSDPDISDTTDIEPTVERTSVSGDLFTDRTEYSAIYTASDSRTLVMVNDARVESLEVDGGEHPPDRIAEWCRQQGIDPVGSSRRQYRELYIPPGDSVYVHGQARRHTAGERAETTSDLVVGTDGDSSGLLVADRPEDEVSSLLAWHWRLRFIPGLFLFLFGVLGVIIGLFMFSVMITHV